MDCIEATDHILKDFEEKPEALDMLMEGSGVSRHEAMRMHVAMVAANFVADGLEGRYARPGQIAQELSGWHQMLQVRCASHYQNLTTVQRLDREVANADSELLTLQALRRGVRDAMRTRYRWAHNWRVR